MTVIWAFPWKMGGAIRYSLYHLARGCTQLSLAQCFCHPEVLRLSVLAQQQIFFLLVDKDLINPEHQYFIDEAHPSKVPPKAADISLILILVHASSSLSSWSICRGHSCCCHGFCQKWQQGQLPKSSGWLCWTAALQQKHVKCAYTSHWVFTMICSVLFQPSR